MVITSDFQSDDVSSILSTRSKLKGYTMLGIYYATLSFDDGTEFKTMFVEEDKVIKKTGKVLITFEEEEIEVNLQDFTIHFITAELNAVNNALDKIKNGEIESINPFKLIKELP